MMMKKSLILLAALVLTFTGCSNEEAVEPSSYVAKGTPIKVNAIVEELTGELSTKVGIDDTKLTEFCLRINNLSNQTFTYYAWMKLNESTNTWEAYTDNTYQTELKMYWAGDNYPVKVTAASFDFQNVQKPTLPDFANDQTEDTNFKKNDWLIMDTADRDPSESGVINVNLRHLMATLTVKINLGTGVTNASNPLSNVNIIGTDCARKVIMPEENRYKWTDGDATSKLEITPHLVSYTAGDATTSAVATYQAFIIPQTIAAGSLQFNLTYDGNTYSYTYSPDVDFEFTSNTPYTITLNMPTSTGE